MCGQTSFRSFCIAGHLLPVCQRCTGLYLGMTLAYLLLFSNSSFRAGLPPRSIIITCIISLLIMFPFGYHLIDPGPSWRFWTGLLFGNALGVLLSTAGFNLMTIKKSLSTNWNQSQTLQFWILLAVINLLPIFLPVQTSWCYVLFLSAIVIGFFTSVLIVILTIIFFCFHLFKNYLVGYH